MKPFCVGESAGGQPKPFIVSDRFHHERVLLPMSNGRSVIARHRFGGLAEGAPVRIDDAPIPVASAQQHENAPEFFLLDKLKTILHLKLPRAAGGKTTGKRVIL